MNGLCVRGIEVHLHGLAVQIPRRLRPLLAFTAIAAAASPVSVAACERLVDVQQPLHPVVARFQVLRFSIG